MKRLSIQKLNTMAVVAALFTALSAALGVTPAMANDQAKGLEIAKERKQRDLGWGIRSRPWKCFSKMHKAKVAFV